MSRVFKVQDGHVTDCVVETSVGAVAADKLIESLRSEWLPAADLAWLRFIEIASRQGWRSEGCKAYVVTLAKRAASNAP